MCHCLHVWKSQTSCMYLPYTRSPLFVCSLFIWASHQVQYVDAVSFYNFSFHWHAYAKVLYQYLGLHIPSKWPTWISAKEKIHLKETLPLASHTLKKQRGRQKLRHHTDRSLILDHLYLFVYYSLGQSSATYSFTFWFNIVTYTTSWILPLPILLSFLQPVNNSEFAQI